LWRAASIDAEIGWKNLADGFADPGRPSHEALLGFGRVFAGSEQAGGRIIAN
jgi:hypothetical protein